MKGSMIHDLCTFLDKVDIFYCNVDLEAGVEFITILPSIHTDKAEEPR